MKPLGILGSMVLSLLIFSLYTVNLHKKIDKPTVKTEFKKVPPPGAIRNDGTRAQLLTQFSHLPLAFIENRGQIGEEVAYYVKAKGNTIFFTPKGVSFHLSRAVDAEDTAFESLVIPLHFVNANPVPPEGEERLPGRVNSFVGAEKTKWKQGIPIYQRLVYRHLYPGIDLIYTGAGGELKYEFVVHPGADLSQIRLAYEGIEGLGVDADGALRIKTAWGFARDDAPYCYQEIAGERVKVKGRFKRIGERTFTFAVDDYQPNYPLIIDPTLSYATYLGGSGENRGHGIAVDGAGNVYVTGMTFPVELLPPNTFDDSYNGGASDAFVAKFSATGTLVYFTYLGGRHIDIGIALAVDGTGNIYVTGETESQDFPSQNAFDDSFNGVSGAINIDYDAFVTKLSSSGTLLYSTYLGGSAPDSGIGIAVDGLGNAYVTGSTKSIDFPTQNALDNSLGDGLDSFVTKLSAAGNSLIYSTYLGGSLGEGGSTVAVDGLGNAYVTGWAASPDFPTQNAYDDSHNRGNDAFVTKLSASGTLLYSTYLGGSEGDSGIGIAVDGLGNAYVTGWTESIDFPTQNPLDQLNSGKSDAFVTKLSAVGRSLAYSTYLGGSEEDFGTGVKVDDAGNAYLTGYTKSADFPTHNADNAILNQNQNIGNDAFVAHFLPDPALVISPTHSTLTADKDPVIADGVDEVTVTIRVMDALGQTIPGHSVTIDVTGTGNQITQPQALTDENGITTAKIHSTQAERKTVTAKVGEQQIALSGSVTLHFIPGPVAKVSISAKPQVLVADGKSTSTLTITVIDAQENPIQGQQPKISLTPNLGRVSGITDQGDGIYTTTYTSPLRIEELTKVILSVLVSGVSNTFELTLIDSLRQTEVLITDISPQLIKLGEKAQIVGKITPPLPIGVTLMFRHEKDAIEESTNSDANGEYALSFTPTHAGEWEVVASWPGDLFHAGAQSEPKVFSVQKVETQTTLQSSPDPFSLTTGDDVLLSGRILPNPGSVDVILTIMRPDGTEQSKGIHTDSTGQYRHELTLDQEGTWNIEARFNGNDDYFGSDNSLRLPVGKEFGRAIIVAGGPHPAENNTLWPTTRYLSNFAYKTLQGRGYGGEMIRYLTPAPFEDVDGDKHNDATGSATVENLRKAITEWSVAFFQRNLNAQLVLYITGHGFEDQFQLDDEREIVTANQIDQWLDIIQRQTGLSQIIILIDGSRSGSFIDELSADGRTIITSTDAFRTVYFGKKGRQSFSQFFLQHLSLGHSVAKSFRLASEAFVLLPEHLRPKPLLDSDGNGRANDDTDRVRADKLFVGLDIKPGTTIPVIDQVSPPQEIEETTTAQIWAEVRTVQGVQEVWAVIIPPNYQPPAKDDGSSRFELPVISLRPSEEGERYEGSYDGFVRPGEYTVIIYAEDKVGNVSVPKQTSVTVRITVASLLPTTLGKLKTALLPNYPNPFNPETWIPYKLAVPIQVVITIYNLNGVAVQTLDLGFQPAGVYVEKERAAYWDGKNDSGEPVASGVYFYTLKAGRFAAIRRMLLVK